MTAGRRGHHLIDPRTARPAETNVVQSTVVAPTAREAEVLAKAALILGAAAGLRYLARSAAHAAVLLLETDEVVTSPGHRPVAGMKYRGLSRRTRWLRWGLVVGLVAIIVAGTASDAISGLTRWLGTDSSSLSWYGSRLFGFLAYGALTASVVYGLLLSTGILDAIAHRAVSFTLHQELAALGPGADGNPRRTARS